jgi:1-acyl-sn-glycerol-3-phosphate acyltransferase
MTASLLASLVRLVAGVPRQGGLPAAKAPRIYFANHSSHLDFVVIWASLPGLSRRRVRPVAAADYWRRGRVRSFLAARVFRAVLIARDGVGRQNNPLEPMLRVLEEGEDLIIFPEGTRSRDGVVQEFKSGIYHLARRFPEAELVPVHLENLNRILPKGEFLPVPLLGRVGFGAPVGGPREDESKADFLARCRAGVLAAGGVSS